MVAIIWKPGVGEGDSGPLEIGGPETPHQQQPKEAKTTGRRRHAHPAGEGAGVPGWARPAILGTRGRTDVGPARPCLELPPPPPDRGRRRRHYLDNDSRTGKSIVKSPSCSETGRKFSRAALSILSFCAFTWLAVMFVVLLHYEEKTKTLVVSTS